MCYCCNKGFNLVRVTRSKFQFGRRIAGSGRIVGDVNDEAGNECAFFDDDAAFLEPDGEAAFNKEEAGNEDAFVDDAAVGGVTDDEEEARPIDRGDGETLDEDEKEVEESDETVERVD